MSVPVTITISQKTKDAIQGIADVENRSFDSVVLEALDNYIELREWQEEGIKKALAQVEAGEVVPHEDVMRKFLDR